MKHTFANLAAWKAFTSAASKNPERPSIRGPFLSQGVLAATDGRRIHAFDFGPDAFPDLTCPAPGNPLTPPKGRPSQGFTLHAAPGDGWGFDDAPRVPASEHQLPMVRQVIPQPAPTDRTATIPDAKAPLKALKGIAQERGELATALALTTRGLTLVTRWGRRGTATNGPRPELLDNGEGATWSGDPVLVNPGFFREALAFVASAAGDRAVIEIRNASPIDPIVISVPALPGGPRPLAVIMPLRAM